MANVTRIDISELAFHYSKGKQFCSRLISLLRKALVVLQLKCVRVEQDNNDNEWEFLI